VEVLTRRYYKIRPLEDVRTEHVAGRALLRAAYDRLDRRVQVVATRTSEADLDRALAAVADAVSGEPGPIVVDLYAVWDQPIRTDDLAAHMADRVSKASLPSTVRRVQLAAYHPPSSTSRQLTFRLRGDGFVEDLVFRGMHPMIARRLELWRLENFEVTRLPSAEDVYLFDCVARDNPADERLIAVAEVRDFTPLHDEAGRITSLPQLEQVLAACLDSIRRARSERPKLARLEWNRVMLLLWPVVDAPLDELQQLATRLSPLTEGLGLEQVAVRARLADPAGGEPADLVLRLRYQAGTGATMTFTEPSTRPLQPLDDYTQRVLQARRRGQVYPYELVSLLAGPGGRWVEHDLDDAGILVPVDRPPGQNRAGVVAGVVSTPTTTYPEGVRRVVVLGDPTRALGSIAEPECRRLLAAIDLAAQESIPLEWFALSAGAKIAMDSGTENLDWVARVLRRLVEHTQDGGEVNVVVTGINVGAQPYWNAESTMLMHTTGILVMLPDSAMVLTGKQALDYSGGVSAEDNLGLGGYERIMGPNGEAQYWARDAAAAVQLLMAHYAHTYVAPGEDGPRRAATDDPVDRDVRGEPHQSPDCDFTTVGDIFSEAANRDRKKPFDIRTLMRAVIDHDLAPIERWSGMQDAETAVVFDAHLGGYPAVVIGVESRPLPRFGAIPADGPAQWSAGTLFPLSSKKVARAINAASGNRPVVVLANLSGFDGSPESLRRLQLEYGAEIGRAIVNFDGTIVLCVVSRYHGGAFVVFSAKLNDRMQVLAVEGSFASVIGGAPAAAVVFTGDVDRRTDADPRVVELEGELTAADGEERARLRIRLADVRAAVRMEKLGELAAEFDAIHSVERALEVGSVHRIIPAASLRPALVEAIERDR
jgi:acetyl-CoA carboxylase carboxyltransferase component